MAKKEHTGEVTGGLTGAGVLDGLDFGASKRVGEEPRVSKVTPASTTGGTPISIYGKRQKTESKSFKMNVLLKPSLVEKMDQAISEGEIKSRNALIVDLLEQHFAMAEAVKSGKFTTREALAEYLIHHYCPWA